jgi:hypothetical protein
MKAHTHTNNSSSVMISKVFLTALLIIVSSINLFSGNDPEVTGEFESGKEFLVKGYAAKVDNKSFVINDYTFVVTRHTEYRGKNGSIFSFEQIKEGSLLEVRAELKADNNLTAISVMSADDKVPAAYKIEITGTVVKLTQSSIILSQSQKEDTEELLYEFFVDDKTEILNNEKEPISYKELTSGLRVEVTAIAQTGYKYQAVRIKLEDPPAYKIELNGEVENISKSSITISKVIFAIDDNTVFIENEKLPASGTVISVGMWVGVKGIKRTNGTYYASEIQAEDAVRGGDNVKDKFTGTLVQSQLKSNSAAVDGESVNTAYDFNLEQNYPNPFNPSTTISFLIQSDQHVSLRVFNAIGKEVKTLVDSDLSKGSYSFNFNAEGLSSGLYLYKLESGEQVQIRKMVLLK